MTVEGVIIKEYNLGESDKTFVIFTREHGKMRMAASGIRNYRSKLGGNSRFLQYARFVLKKGKSLYRVQECERIEGFDELRKDLNALSVGTYLAEITSEALPEGEPCQELFRFFLNTLHFLSQNPQQWRFYKSVYELHLVCQMGYRPVLEQCTVCGKTDGSFSFSNERNGLLCMSCGGGSLLPQEIIHGIRFMVSASMKEVFSVVAAEHLLITVSAISEAYLVHILGKTPRSLTYLHRMEEILEDING